MDNNTSIYSNGFKPMKYFYIYLNKADTNFPEQKAPYQICAQSMYNIYMIYMCFSCEPNYSSLLTIVMGATVKEMIKESLA